MTDKKSKDKENKILLPHEEIISKELLFRSQTITERIIEERNRESDSSKVRIGMTEMTDAARGFLKHKNLKPSEVFNEYKSYTKKKKTMWLEKVWSPRSNKFHTIENLIANGNISEEERQYYKFPPEKDITDFPWRETSSIYRIKALDGKEYYSDIQQWYGVDLNGTVHMESFIADLWSYILPDFDRQYRYHDGKTASPNERNNSDVGQISILKKQPSGELAGQVVYTLEFTPEVLHSGLKLARGEVGDSYHGVALTLVDEKVPNMALSVKTVEEFLLPFDQLWKEKSEMRAMSRIDTNAFVSDLQKVTEQFKQQSDKGSQTQYR